MSRKGVSAEEKRIRMLQLFYEKKQFYQLKDLEKLAPKEKGIISNAVKDVLQQLVDDGLVDTDKIGQSTYFWAFPSKAKNVKKRKLTELNEQYNDTKKKLKIMTDTIEMQSVSKENTSQKCIIMDSISDLQIEQDKLSKELENYKENDPKVFEKMKNDIQPIKEAANRWTDNIFTIKTWCKNKFFMENDVLDKQFEIPTELDYID